MLRQRDKCLSMSGLHRQERGYRAGLSITLQFVRPDIRQSCNLLWALSA
jgi:hypothetical protein